MTLQISYKRIGDVHTIETGNASLGTLVLDQTHLPEDQRGGTAKQLLASSAMYCYCASVAGALDARGTKWKEIRGTATLETGEDSEGRARVTSLALDVTVSVDEDDVGTVERVSKVLRKGCLLTASLDVGIPVTYALNPETPDD